MRIRSGLGLGRRLSGAAGSIVGRARLPCPHWRSHAAAATALPNHRRADGRAGPRAAWYGRLGRQHAHARVRRRALRTRATARRLALLHHHSRHARPRQVVQALGRSAHEVPEVQLRGHGGCALPTAHRALEHQASARGHRQLDGRHGDLDLRCEVSRVHGYRGTDGLLADGDVEPQLDDASADHRLDSQ